MLKEYSVWAYATKSLNLRKLKWVNKIVHIIFFRIITTTLNALMQCMRPMICREGKYAISCNALYSSCKSI